MYLGIDIGGTKTLVALFNKRGRIIRRTKFRTDLQYEKFLSDLTGVLKKYSTSPVKAVTMAIPGVVQKNCSVAFGNRNWGVVDLYTPIKSMFACPVYVENDANLGAAYESCRLPGKTIFLTFSTGIGGGIAVRGKILPESSDFEPGHKIYTLGNVTAEWEDIAAASALEKYFQITPATDIRGKTAMKEVARRVALGLPEIVSEYHPRTIVLGGPLGKIFKLYVKYLPKFNVKYRRPRRSLESVIYGCYLYSKRNSK